MGSILFYVVLVLALGAFIYFTVKTAGKWGILHTLLLCCLFIEAWVFLAMSAGVHYARVPATKRAFEAEIKANRAESETIRLEWGDYGIAVDSEDAVIPMNGRLRRMTAERGRLWRRVALMQEAAGTYQLEMPVADLEDDGTGDPAQATAPNSESLPEGLVVYGFGEELDEEGRPLPKHYLGEFVVKQSQAGQVAVAPTRPLFGTALAKIADGTASTWALYELLPLDSHEAFAAQGAQPNENEVWGHMEEAELQALFADVTDEGGLRQRIIDSYLKDGTRADETTPQENIWVQVQLEGAWKESVDSQDSADATERGYFDPAGRSIDARLKVASTSDDDAASGDVTLNQENTRGQLVVIKEEAARNLPAGTAKEASRVNVRPLNDYERAFNQIYIQNAQLDEQLARIARDTTSVQKADQAASEMIVMRQTENQELESDFANLKRELAKLEVLASEEETRLADLKKEMSDMYRRIQTEHARRKAAELSMLTSN